jgi:hypothetical protein
MSKEQRELRASFAFLSTQIRRSCRENLPVFWHRVQQLLSMALGLSETC